MEKRVWIYCYLENGGSVKLTEMENGSFEVLRVIGGILRTYRFYSLETARNLVQRTVEMYDWGRK